MVLQTGVTHRIFMPMRNNHTHGQASHATRSQYFHTIAISMQQNIDRCVTRLEPVSGKRHDADFRRQDKSKDAISIKFSNNVSESSDSQPGNLLIYSYQPVLSSSAEQTGVWSSWCEVSVDYFLCGESGKSLTAWENKG